MRVSKAEHLLGVPVDRLFSSVCYELFSASGTSEGAAQLLHLGCLPSIRVPRALDDEIGQAYFRWRAAFGSEPRAAGANHQMHLDLARPIGEPLDANGSV